MPEDSAPDGLAWFHSLPMDDQIALLSDPDQPLSPRLTDRLSKQPKSKTRWVGSTEPSPWHLSAPEVLRLNLIRKQLDAWWERLAHHEHPYLIQQRAGELDATYAETVLAATGDLTRNPNALVVALVRDLRNENTFRLPPMIRTYVEMQAQ